MDLREKPGMIQTVVELLRRFRLIFLMVFIPMGIFFSPSIFEMVTYVLGAAESVAMSFFELQKGNHGQMLQLFPWVLGFIVCLFVLRYFFFGVSGMIALFWAFIFVPVLVFLLNGSEEYILPLAGGIFVLLVVLTVLIKSSVACAFVPVFFSLFAVTAFSVKLGLSYLVWGSFVVLAIADVFSLSFSTGLQLREGISKDGALLRVFRAQIPGIFFSALILALFSALPKILAHESPALIAFALIPSGIYFVWITFVLFPLITFAPLGRLRAEKRRVTLQEKKERKKIPSKKK